MNGMFFGTKGPMLRAPKITPRFDGSPGGHPGQRRVVLRAVIYYSQKMQSKISGGEKVCGAKSRGCQKQASRVLSQKSHTGHAQFLQQRVVTTCAKCCQPTKLVRVSVPRVFIGGCSQRHLLPGRYPNSGLPEGKQMFSINHIVCTDSLGTVRHSCQLMVVGTLPKSRILDTSQGPTL